LPRYDERVHHTDILGQVGRTPLLELTHLPLPPGVRLFAKLEGQNPSGSVKDRIALRMIRAAEEEGWLRPGATLVEPTTGNTGIALSVIGRRLGYRVRVVVPENVFPAIAELMRAYGAEITWSPANRGIRGAREIARQIAADEGAVILDQFANAENCAAHYQTTAPEILADLPRVDAFIAGLGTGGTLMGVGQRLKEANPASKVFAVEPQNPGVQVQGLKSLDDGFVPPILDLGLLDGKILVRSRSAFVGAHRLARHEGLFAGVSAGAVVHAALRWAERLERGNIVVLLADGGWKYVGTPVWNILPRGDDDEEDELDEILWW
jgi:cysteine synthase B